MYTNSTLKPIQDDELYIGLDGTQWANTDKSTISELHHVTLTDAPDASLNYVTGFHIDESYTQVWDYTPKAQDEIVGTKEYNLKHYAELRAKEYPPMSDYLDAIVKSDEKQKQEYINKCLAVKLKYPKE